MTARSQWLLISDIVDSASKSLKYSEALSYDNFMYDSPAIDALMTNLRRIVEAESLLPEALKAQHQETEWNLLRFLRSEILKDCSEIELPLSGK